MAVATSTIIGAIGVAASVAGTAVSMKGAAATAKASERAEKLRERQMKLDAAKERRQLVRQAVMARANTVAAGVAQGAGGGSAIAGGIGQVMGEASRGLVYNRQSERIGGGIFQQNAAMARGQGLQSLGQGVSGFGGMMVDNADRFGRLTNYYSNRQGT